jgi:hypothetical protein
MSTAGTIPWPPRWTSAVIVRCETSHDPSRHHSATPRANTPTVMAVSRAPRAKTGCVRGQAGPPQECVVDSTDLGSASRSKGEAGPVVWLRTTSQPRCACQKPLATATRNRDPRLWPISCWLLPHRGGDRPGRGPPGCPAARGTTRPARSRRSRPGMSARWCVVRQS